MAVLSLGAFGIGGFVSGLAGSLAGPPVSALSVLHADAGVPVATNNLDAVTAILGALRGRIAAEYVSSASTGTGTVAHDRTLVPGRRICGRADPGYVAAACAAFLAPAALRT
jgi:hypothetical protein